MRYVDEFIMQVMMGIGFALTMVVLALAVLF
jgi:hypothetical protein